MGTTELVVIAGVGLVFFGPGRIPEFAKQCGRAVTQFKRGLSGALEEEPAPAKAPKRRERAR